MTTTTKTDLATQANRIAALLATSAALQEHSRRAGSHAAGLFGRVAMELFYEAERLAEDLTAGLGDKHGE